MSPLVLLLLLLFSKCSAILAENATKNLIKEIYDERPYQTLVILQQNLRRATACDELSSTKTTDYALVQLQGKEYTFKLKSHFNSQMLIVVCMENIIDNRLVEQLVNTLEHMRTTRILFVFSQLHLTPYATMRSLFKLCAQHKMPHVLAIVADNYEDTKVRYSYTNFPTFLVKMQSHVGNYYAEHLTNLYGYELLTQPSQAEPRSIVYRSSDGALHQLGYVYHLIVAFAAHINATLAYKYPINLGHTIESDVLMNLTQHNELDFPICFSTLVDSSTFYSFSDAVEITDWKPMLPKATYISKYQIYAPAFSTERLLYDVLFFYVMSLLYFLIKNELSTKPLNVEKLRVADVVLNDRIYRGMLAESFDYGQQLSFKLRVLYFTLFFRGLIFATIVVTYLNVTFTNPPTGREINSFHDIKTSGLKVLMTETDLELLEKISEPEFMREYREVFQTIPTMTEFKRLKNSMNTDFAYAIRWAHWALFKKQQRYFSRRLFRASENVYFRRFMLLALPMPEHSIYRDAFNKFVLDVQAHGFWQYWHSIGFFEMVQAKKMTFRDVTTARSYKPLAVGDLFYIWLYFLIGTVLAVLAFLGEFLFAKYSGKLRELFKWSF